jgi:hypothetical protein
MAARHLRRRRLGRLRRDLGRLPFDSIDVSDTAEVSDASTPRGRRSWPARHFVAGLTTLALVAGCGDDGNDSGSSAAGTTASVTTARTSTSVAVATTSVTTTPPAPRRCSGQSGSFDVPAGWYANVQPPGTAAVTCSIVAPLEVARRLTLVGDVMQIPDETLRAMEGGPWIHLSVGPAAVTIVAGIVRDLDSDVVVTAEPSGVRLSKPVAGLSWRVIEPAGGSGTLRALRLTYTRTTDGGYYQKGTVEDVLLIEKAGATLAFASLNSTELTGTPPPGITMADVAMALDTIASTFRP